MNERFERQVRFAPLGSEGQARLGRARVVLVGCGALGGALAQSLVRSGVGQLVLVDRDVVETSNLPRQVLFDERHARERTPKVEAARETLARIGGPTSLELQALHLDADNIEDLAENCDLLLDGTDNLATRYLVNDYSVEEGVPWVYGGVVGSGGLAMPVVPGRGPCLRCVFPDPPPPGSLPTCDTAGVLQPAVALVAAIQAGCALRMLADTEGLDPEKGSTLFEVDVWDGRLRTLNAVRDPACPCCGPAGERPYLHRPVLHPAVRLCGRNAVQVRGRVRECDLEALAETLREASLDVQLNPTLLRFEADGARFSVFADGRALIEGTEEVERALTLYDRYVGS